MKTQKDISPLIVGATRGGVKETSHKTYSTETQTEFKALRENPIWLGHNILKARYEGKSSNLIINYALTEIRKFRSSLYAE